MDVTQANGMQTHETSRITMQQLSCRCGPGLGYKTTKRGNKRSYEKEEIIMASRSSNRAAVPEAKGALDKFKYEVASELGVPLSDGYNSDCLFTGHLFFLLLDHFLYHITTYRSVLFGS